MGVRPFTFELRPIYPILDVEAMARGGHDVVKMATELAAMGLDLLQLRAKEMPSNRFLELADRLAAVTPRLIINDRADLALLAGAAGVHVGQEDLPWPAVRQVLKTLTVSGNEADESDEAIVGVSTHNLEQARAALTYSSLHRKPDYLAIGPIFATGSKANPDPAVGTEGIRRVREIYDGPLVAIGGIGLEQCEAVWRAGADSVAVISALWSAADPAAAARQLLLAFQRVSCHSPEKTRGGEAPSRAH